MVVENLCTMQPKAGEQERNRGIVMDNTLTKDQQIKALKLELARTQRDLGDLERETKTVFVIQDNRELRRFNSESIFVEYCIQFNKSVAEFSHIFRGKDIPHTEITKKIIKCKVQQLQGEDNERRIF